MLAFLLLVAIGAVSAIFGSIVGLGGGIVIVPALLYMGPVLLGREISATTAVGTSLTVLIVTALASTLVYMKRNRVDFRSGWLFFITSGPASILGALLTGSFSQQTFHLLFGFFMLFMAGLLAARDYLKPAKIRWKIRRTYTDDAGMVREYGYNLLPALLVGFLVGTVSGLFGIGGGSLFVPVMVLLFSFPPQSAVGTSMFVIFLSSILGSGTHIAAGEIDWFSAAALAPGAWMGGRLGAAVASRMSGRGLLWLLRATLSVMAVRMIAQGFGYG